MFNNGVLNTTALLWLLPLIIWTIIWKGLSLWRAARNEDKAWFVVMMILNTAGILEIIYYFGFSNKKVK